MKSNAARRLPTPTERAERADLFRLLARLYARAVDGAVLRRLAQTGVLADLGADPEIVTRLAVASDALVEELATAHTALFCGPGRHVAPYASCHHPGERGRSRLWGDATVWFRRFVLDHGLRFEGPAYEGIPDHIAYELEVYGRFVDRADELAATDPDGEPAVRLRGSMAVLIEQHLVLWIPHFCGQALEHAAQLESAAGRALYSAVIELTEALIEDEHRRLSPPPEGEKS